MSCQKCPCPDCERARASQDDPYGGFTDYGTPGPAPGVDRWHGPQVVRNGVVEPECAIERFAREYAARGEPMPATFMLSCKCRKCTIQC